MVSYNNQKIFHLYEECLTFSPFLQNYYNEIWLQKIQINHKN